MYECVVSVCVCVCVDGCVHGCECVCLTHANSKVQLCLPILIECVRESVMPNVSHRSLSLPLTLFVLLSPLSSLPYHPLFNSLFLTLPFLLSLSLMRTLRILAESSGHCGSLRRQQSEGRCYHSTSSH